MSSSSSTTSSSSSSSSSSSLGSDGKEEVYIPSIATNMASRNQFDRAIQMYTEWIDSQGEHDDYRVFFNRAFCFYELDMFEEALNDIDMVIQMKPDWIKGHHVRGKILLQLKQWEMAHESFMSSFKKDRQEDTIRWIRKTLYFYLMDTGLYTDFEADYAASKTLTLQEAKDLASKEVFNLCLWNMRVDKFEKFKSITKSTGRIFPKSYSY